MEYNNPFPASQLISALFLTFPDLHRFYRRCKSVVVDALLIGHYIVLDKFRFGLLRFKSD